MSKRRWWEGDERFKKVHANLRKNYDLAITRVEQEYREKLERGRKELAAAARARIDEAERHASELASEIARVRFEVGVAANFNRRYIMTVTMDESFMVHAQSLREIGPYVIEVLVAKLRREFAQVDWTRAQPTLGNPMFPGGSRVFDSGKMGSIPEPKVGP